MLHIEIVLDKKQPEPEAETSLVHWRSSSVLSTRERELNERRGKKKNKDVKHVKCKDVLRFICGFLWYKGNTSGILFENTTFFNLHISSHK